MIVKEYLPLLFFFRYTLSLHAVVYKRQHEAVIEMQVTVDSERLVVRIEGG